MRGCRALWLTLLVLLLLPACAAAEFHPEWILRNAVVRVRDIAAWVPKQYSLGRDASLEQTDITARISEQIKKKVYVTLCEDDSTKDAFMEGNILYIRKFCRPLEDGEEVPEGKSVFEVTLENGTTCRAAVFIGEDEDAAGIRLDPENLQEIYVKQRLLAEGEEPPEGWTVVTDEIEGTQVRMAVDLSRMAGKENFSVEIGYENHLEVGDMNFLLYTAAFFRPVPWSMLAGPEMTVPEGVRQIDVATIVQFQMVSRLDLVSMLIPDDEAYADDPYAILLDGRVWVQVRQNCKVLAEGEEPPAGSAVFTLTMLDMIPGDYFFTDDELMKFTDEQKKAKLERIGLVRPCPDCEGTGQTPDGLPCAGCAEMPGYVNASVRVVPVDADGRPLPAGDPNLLALPAMQLVNAHVQRFDGDKTVPDGWYTLNEGELRGVPVLQAADLRGVDAMVAVCGYGRILYFWRHSIPVYDLTSPAAP